MFSEEIIAFFTCSIPKVMQWLSQKNISLIIWDKLLFLSAIKQKCNLHISCVLQFGKDKGKIEHGLV
jgi:hypothetical protein